MIELDQQVKPANTFSNPLFDDRTNQMREEIITQNDWMIDLRELLGIPPDEPDSFMTTVVGLLLNDNANLNAKIRMQEALRYRQLERGTMTPITPSGEICTNFEGVSIRLSGMADNITVCKNCGFFEKNHESGPTEKGE